VDGSHEWKWGRSGDCGRVVIEESCVSKSSRRGTQCHAGLLLLLLYYHCAPRLVLDKAVIHLMPFW